MTRMNATTYTLGLLPIDEIENAMRAEDQREPRHWSVLAPRVDSLDLDTRLCDEIPEANCWRRFETASDRPSFGIWTQRDKRLVLLFENQTITLSGYGNSESYDTALVELCEKHDELPLLAILHCAQGGDARPYESRRPLFRVESLFDAWQAKLIRRMGA